MRQQETLARSSSADSSRLRGGGVENEDGSVKNLWLSSTSSCGVSSSGGRARMSMRRCMAEEEELVSDLK